jgi:hypothetical protein
MAQMGREQLFQRLLIWFVLYTTIIGILNLAWAGGLTLSDIGGSTGGYIPGQIITGTGAGSNGYIEGANIANGSVSNGVDFTAISLLNGNITTTIGGSWLLENSVGLVLISLPIFPGVFNPSVVLARNVQSSNGIYTVSTKVNNVPGTDFYVTPRFITGISGSDIKVIFKSDGVHISKFPLYLGVLDNGDDYFFPYAQSQITASGGSTITTQLTETVSSQNSNTPDYTSLLTVSKDGTTLFTNVKVRSILPGDNINDQVRHGGAGSDTANFIVMGFPNTPMLNNGGIIISGNNARLQGDFNPLTAVTDFLGLVSTILGISNSALVPFWLWAIIGIPSISTIMLIYAEMIRGN